MISNALYYGPATYFHDCKNNTFKKKRHDSSLESLISEKKINLSFPFEYRSYITLDCRFMYYKTLLES